MNLLLLYVCVIIVTTTLVTCKKTITIISDFENAADKEFFKITFPWLVNNIGFELNVKFHFLDSGINSGPRKCVLKDININIYLQASYLECIANGKENDECIKSLPIDIRAYNNCLKRNVEGFVKEAERENKRTQIDSTPAVQIERINRAINLDPLNILNSICETLGRNSPKNCFKPLPTPEKKVPENDSNNIENGIQDKNDNEKAKDDELNKEVEKDRNGEGRNDGEENKDKESEVKTEQQN